MNYSHHPHWVKCCNSLCCSGKYFDSRPPSMSKRKDSSELCPSRWILALQRKAPSREGPGRAVQSWGPRLGSEPSSPRSEGMPQCSPILPQSPAVLGPLWSLISTKERHSQEQGEQRVLILPCGCCSGHPPVLPAAAELQGASCRLRAF